MTELSNEKLDAITAGAEFGKQEATDPAARGFFRLAFDAFTELKTCRAQLAELRKQEPVGAFHITAGEVEATTDYCAPGKFPIQNGLLEVYSRPVPQAVSHRDTAPSIFDHYIDEQIKFYSYMCERDDAIGSADSLTMSQHRLRFYQEAKTLFSSAKPVVRLSDRDFGAVQHMSGGSDDYCNGFVDGAQYVVEATLAAGVEVSDD